MITCHCFLAAFHSTLASFARIMQGSELSLLQANATMKPGRLAPMNIKTVLLCLAVPALAQEHHHHHSNFAGNLLMNQASGTSLNPASWSMPMVMKTAGSWNLMFMGNAFLVETQQT